MSWGVRPFWKGFKGFKEVKGVITLDVFWRFFGVFKVFSLWLVVLYTVFFFFPSPKPWSKPWPKIWSTIWSFFLHRETVLFFMSNFYIGFFCVVRKKETCWFLLSRIMGVKSPSTVFCFVCFLFCVFVVAFCFCFVCCFCVFFLFFCFAFLFFFCFVFSNYFFLVGSWGWKPVNSLFLFLCCFLFCAFLQFLFFCLLFFYTPLHGNKKNYRGSRYSDFLYFSKIFLWISMYFTVFS